MTKRLSKLQRWILTKCLEEVPYHRNTTRDFFGKRFSPSEINRRIISIGGDLEQNAKRILGDEYKELVVKKEGSFRVWNFETQIHETKVSPYYTIKEELCSSRAEEATISRTLKNLVDKGLLKQPEKWGAYFLTEEGFTTANKVLVSDTTVNKCLTDRTNVNERLDDPTTVNTTARGANKLTFEEYQIKANAYLSQRAKFFEPRKEASPEKQQKVFELKTKLNEFQRKFNPDAISAVCCEFCQKKIEELANECGKSDLEELKKQIESIE